MIKIINHLPKLGLLTYLCFSIVACASHRTKLDAEVSSMLSNDMTAPIMGCGQQPIVGYTYCRKTEGSQTTDIISFFAPDTKCGKKVCVHGTIYSPDGQPALGVPFADNATRQDLSWMTILKSPTFEAGTRGIYLWCLSIEFLDPNGIMRTSQTCGEIRLRVVAKNYLPLHNAPSDPNFVWIWCDNKWIMKMTTNGRTFIGDRCD